MISAGLVLLLGSLGASSAAAPPPPESLFGCPLAAPMQSFEAPREWQPTAVEGLDLLLDLPPRWELVVDGDVATARPPNRRHRITVRQSRLVSHDRLHYVRRAVELTELGPSHAGERCEESLRTVLRQATGFDPLTVGVYGRPLGERRRSYALFATHGQGTITVVVTVRWGRSDPGPPLDLVRALLGGVRRGAALSDPGASSPADPPGRSG